MSHKSPIQLSSVSTKELGCIQTHLRRPKQIHYFNQDTIRRIDTDLTKFSSANPNFIFRPFTLHLENAVDITDLILRRILERSACVCSCNYFIP